ncbi:helix-turn-helix domain-containing protein [Rossellomorea marisflavi]|jgi:putative transcriptional regulator|uniref:helix-turn-helix domain-containing protein n=1 Tax=Rossellomorea marisflavi TaxID=189381 RepID=UPI002852FC89|nr:helix-turn-helix domain-containing protein [Rossellomorea marisflavi]MDR4936038.1 helix-turn-helix domain-containing protein [Rossellomorea marisflavi]
MAVTKKRKFPISIVPSYKPMEITLIRRDKKKSNLRNDLGLSPATLAKMSNGEYVALDIIGLICEYLDCNIEDVVTFVHKEGTSE